MMTPTEGYKFIIKITNQATRFTPPTMPLQQRKRRLQELIPIVDRRVMLRCFVLVTVAMFLPQRYTFYIYIV